MLAAWNYFYKNVKVTNIIDNTVWNISVLLKIRQDTQQYPYLYPFNNIVFFVLAQHFINKTVSLALILLILCAAVYKQQKGFRMTIGNALKFIDRGRDDKALRDRLNGAADMAACENLLSQEGLMFTAHDFDEAFHHRLTLCQEEDEADQIREFRMWWEMLCRILTPGSSRPSCSGCCWKLLHTWHIPCFLLNSRIFHMIYN